MALIKCNECGHMISSNADACPKCGYPVGKEVSFSEDNNSIKKKPSKPSKSHGGKWSLSNILWLVIPLVLFVAIEYFFIAWQSASHVAEESHEELYEESYGPGTYEFVDEAKQKWQLVIELETEGSEADYSLVEHKKCKLKNKSNGEEYKGFWYDDSSLYHKKGEQIAHYYKCFRICFYFAGSETNYKCPIIFQKNAEFNDWFYLEDGYIYINSDQKEDTNGKGFGFEEAFINRDPRIRLPIKRIK